MARLICWMLLNVPPPRLRRIAIGVLATALFGVAVLFALIGFPRLAIYLLAAALVVVFIGNWREHLLHSR